MYHLKLLHLQDPCCSASVPSWLIAFIVSGFRSTCSTLISDAFPCRSDLGPARSEPEGPHTGGRGRGRSRGWAPCCAPSPRALYCSPLCAAILEKTGEKEVGNKQVLLQSKAQGGDIGLIHKIYFLFLLLFFFIA